MPVRHATPAETTQSRVPAIVSEVLRSPGKPIDPVTRDVMERRLGHDFGHVRVHADAPANASARAVGARAYTVGHNIVFGAGQFASGTAEGRTLLAHELAHVVQQRGAAAGGGATLTIAPAGDRFEQEADRVANAVTAGGMSVGAKSTSLPQISSTLRSALTLQRQPCKRADDKIVTGPLPTRLPAITCDPTPATLQQVRAVPDVPPTVLGVTERAVSNDQLTFQELKASKCNARVDHYAEIKITQSIYTKDGTFDDGTEKTPHGRACPEGQTVAKRMLVTLEAAKKLKQGEAEHCKDAKLAFALSWGKFNQASKDLEGEYCAAGIPAIGAESICDKEFAKRFTDRTGIEWAKRQEIADCLLAKTALRDSRHWHDVVPTDLFYAPDCKTVTYIITPASAPEIGRHPTADLVKGCGEK